MSLFTFEELQEANTGLKTVDIKGKAYVQVNERIKAFRKLIPDGTIKTEMVYLQDGMCVFKTEILMGDALLSTGYAYEREGTTQINRTSFIENCESSSTGRALAFLGLGIDLSIASAEEVDNAIEQQNAELCISEIMATTIRKVMEQAQVTEEQICKRYKIENLMELKASKFANVMNDLKVTAEKRKNESKDKDVLPQE